MSNTEIPTKDQTIKFWEHWGFTDIYGYPGSGYTGRKPEGKYASLSITNSNLFKHAVPKALKELQEQWSLKNKGTYLTEKGAYQELFNLWVLEIIPGQDVALALFWVLERLIK